MIALATYAIFYRVRASKKIFKGTNNFTEDKNKTNDVINKNEVTFIFGYSFGTRVVTIESY